MFSMPRSDIAVHLQQFHVQTGWERSQTALPQIPRIHSTTRRQGTLNPPTRLYHTDSACNYCLCMFYKYWLRGGSLFVPKKRRYWCCRRLSTVLSVFFSSFAHLLPYLCTSVKSGEVYKKCVEKLIPSGQAKLEIKRYCSFSLGWHSSKGGEMDYKYRYRSWHFYSIP